MLPWCRWASPEPVAFTIWGKYQERLCSHRARKYHLLFWSPAAGWRTARGRRPDRLDQSRTYSALARLELQKKMAKPGCGTVAQGLMMIGPHSTITTKKNVYGAKRKKGLTLCRWLRYSKIDWSSTTRPVRKNRRYMCHGRTNHSSEKADCESRVGEGRDDVTRRAAEKDGGWGEIGD